MARKIKKETFMSSIIAIMISQVMVKILGLVYRLYLTNKEGFGDTGNAIYSSGFQIYALLLTLSSIGVPNAIAKLISEKLAVGDGKGAHRVFKIAFALFSIIGGIGTLILYYGAGFIANNVLHIKEAEYTLIALSPSIFFVSISSVIRGYFNGKQNMKATANSQTIEQLFKTIFTIIIVEIISHLSKYNTVVMAAGANLATTFSTFFSFAYLYIYYKERKLEISQEIKYSKKYKQSGIFSVIKKILAVSIPIMISSLMSVITKNIDAMTVVVELKTFMTDISAKTQYGILAGKVDTLISLPMSLNIAFATTLVPTISGLKAKGDIEGIKDKILLSILITILIGFPCTAGMFIFAEPILKLLFPNASNGTLILQINSMSIIFSLLIQTINGALQGLGKIKIPAISLGIGVLVKLILNLILISNPSIGIYGAGIATFICNIIAFSISFYHLNKELKLKCDLNRFILKPILITLIMCAISYYSYSEAKKIIGSGMSTLISIGIGAIIYLLFIINFKILSTSEFYILPYKSKIKQTLQGVRKKQNIKK